HLGVSCFKLTINIYVRTVFGHDSTCLSAVLVRHGAHCRDLYE
ncbi:uncharacterized protein METZ01_LOCUS61425, partial [marine metagenome]